MNDSIGAQFAVYGLQHMLLILVVLLFTNPLWATPPAKCTAFEQELSPAFQKYYHEEYKGPLLCSDHVFEFIGILKSQGNPLDEITVVHLQHRLAPHIPVKPLHPRLDSDSGSFKASLWIFHSFLLVDGIVLDFDYFNTPQFVGLNIYLKTMWTEDALRQYTFSVKPAEDYKREDLGGTMLSATHSNMTLTEFRKYISHQECLEFFQSPFP